MSIRDSVQKALEGSAGNRTMFKTFYAWYDALSDKDKHDLDTALLSPEISTRKLFYALKENQGVKFGDNALYHYKNSLLNKEN